MAKSHIRLNMPHPNTIFRVRVDGLKPGTTYYYTVDSTGPDMAQRRPEAEGARGQWEGDNCPYICRHPGMVL